MGRGAQFVELTAKQEQQDGFRSRSRSIPGRKVSTLDHKASDNPMEKGALKMQR